MSVAVAAANSAWMVGNLPRWAKFHHALRHPKAVQGQILSRYLRENADTEFGKTHKFATISTAAEYQQRVPLGEYEDFLPYVKQIAAGLQNVLTREPVRHFALSSGSTSAEKWIPYTRSLVAEFGRAIGPWAGNLLQMYPALLGGPAYWSVTPVGPRPIRDSHVPVGFDEDSEYLGGFLKRLVDVTLAVPGELREIEDIDGFQYMTLLCLLRARDLRLISVWHPSFFILLIRAAQRHWDRLLTDIRQGTCHPLGHVPEGCLIAAQASVRPDSVRADELRRHGSANVAAFWPELALVSCWADAHAHHSAGELLRLFPQATLQGKGLLSTEGFVSLPWVVAGSTCYPMAIRSHFFELLPEGGDPITIDEGEIGETYTVIITTGGGLYRYNTHDRVRITGRCQQTPCIEFLGKTDHICDLRGEKLNALFVANVVAELCRTSGIQPQFIMLAPDEAGYTLFLEASKEPPATLPVVLDRLLSSNPQYAYCRALGQLDHAKVFLIEADGGAAYLEACRQQGQRLGNIKLTVLHRGSFWAKVFRGHYQQHVQTDSR